MRLLPFLLAGPHILGVVGIAADSFAVIVAAPSALAIRLATDALLWSITGRLKNLLAVSATPARTHAVLVLLRFTTSNLQAKQNRLPKKYRNFCRVLTASLTAGLKTLVQWLRLKPAELAPSLTGSNKSGYCRLHLCPMTAGVRQLTVKADAIEKSLKP